MLRRLQLENFRALQQFSMSGLGRVNLLVGTNNCGKTSVLEAIHILSARGLSPLVSVLLRRGEVREGTEGEIEVGHLVHGHELREGIRFSVSGSNDIDEQRVTAVFVANDEVIASRPSSRDTQPALFVTDDDNTSLLSPLAMEITWDGHGQTSRFRWPLTRRGGLNLDSPDYRRQVVGQRKADDLAPVTFITTEGLTRETVVEFFDEAVLTPDEETVLQAIRTIEPSIERVASVGTPRRYVLGGRGGIAMLVGGRRVPIGSMGDGIWRLFGIALALVRARGGVLLVDEIDTGLHYSVLVDMWRLVYETAKRLDVQVFATTHSRDCYEALAAVTRDDRHDISLQRMERGKSVAVAFSEAEMRQAAERSIEVR